ncbi:MAG: hypothetical protein WA823_10655 [Candidatus Acidiferrales bacterium]
MRNAFTRVSLLAVLGAFLLSPLAARAQDQTTQATTVITVMGPKFTPPPQFTKDDIAVTEGKTKDPVTNLVPAQGDKARLELAIVVDEANDTSFANQMGDLRNFINGLPQTTAVGVFYANNGSVQALSQFTTDHSAAAKTIRLTLGRMGAYSSIYLSTMDLIKRWPDHGGRREILLIADGIDRFRGDPFSPDVQSTVDTAQKAGIMIHTLYCNGTGRYARNMFRVNYGQSNLAQLTDGTGGESFFQGLQTPLAFAPYLTQLDTILKNQYFLTFSAAPSKNSKGQLRNIRVRSVEKDLDISVADRVWVP